MTSNTSQATVGPWAREKLHALGEYLNFYTTALRNQGHWLQGTYFVDAFAGPGLARIRTRGGVPDDALALFETEAESANAEVDFLEGSPRVALGIKIPFDHYIFVERDAHRAEELRILQRENTSRSSIFIHEGDANSFLDKWLSTPINWRKNRAVVFLDPFGMQVPWHTIQSLARTKAIEIIVNFPLGMAIQRLLLRSGDIPTGWNLSLNTFFGTSEWRDQVYETKNDLFGPKMAKYSDSGERLLKWYRGRLKSQFGFVSPARLIRNTRGGPLYYLIWAGPHPLGLRGAHHVLGKGI